MNKYHIIIPLLFLLAACAPEQAPFGGKKLCLIWAGTYALPMPCAGQDLEKKEGDHETP